MAGLKAICAQVGNFFIVSIIELLAEGMTLAEKTGVQRQHVVQFIETLFPGHIFKGTALCEPVVCSRSSQVKIASRNTPSVRLADLAGVSAHSACPIPVQT